MNRLFLAGAAALLVLTPAYFAIGFIVYFLMRQPLPYNCPQCGTTVGARFNFCPNCKCNLHPSCPQCKIEVVEGDKFCPYCAYDLQAVATPQVGAGVAHSTSAPGPDTPANGPNELGG